MSDAIKAALEAFAVEMDQPGNWGICRGTVARRLREIAGIEAATQSDVVRALVEACDAKDALLVCYRLNKRPSEALFKRLEKAEKTLRAVKEAR